MLFISIYGYYAIGIDPYTQQLINDKFIRFADTILIQSCQTFGNQSFILSQGKLYAFGSSMNLELGSQDTTIYTKVTELPFYQNIPVKQVSLGEQTSAILTTSGQLYIQGRITGDPINPNEPSQLVTVTLAPGETITKVIVVKQVIYILTSNNDVYFRGQCDNGLCGGFSSFTNVFLLLAHLVNDIMAGDSFLLMNMTDNTQQIVGIPTICNNINPPLLQTIKFQPDHSGLLYLSSGELKLCGDDFRFSLSQTPHQVVDSPPGTLLDFCSTNDAWLALTTSGLYVYGTLIVNGKEIMKKYGWELFQNVSEVNKIKATEEWIILYSDQQKQEPIDPQINDTDKVKWQPIVAGVVLSLLFIGIGFLLIFLNKKQIYRVFADEECESTNEIISRLKQENLSHKKEIEINKQAKSTKASRVQSPIKMKDVKISDFKNSDSIKVQKPSSPQAIKSE
ncbi:Regulator_of chromosome condensation (RCC1) repeat-containing protein [Hexamita inflata]|uniref:Regulator of chromosome condensation (RCC1) repeat-containing protein n=1 Tax=Hexamita inflata TaxID=28002 RepID=A0AA86TZ93_9EUKA|nr:Regulator of chromosome condensation (RCC1) repeat-containing protein [Hexamita inflata]